jgi:hypothetical protein
VWEDGSTAPTHLPSAQADLDSPGYSHWVMVGGNPPEPTGDTCAYADYNSG